jgi:hypothetical protein
MQTLQYTRALKQIVKELKVTELLAVFRPFTVRGPNANLEQTIKDQISALMFSSRAGFERLGLEPSTAKVLQSLAVDKVYETSRLGRLLSKFLGFAQTDQHWGDAYHLAEFFAFYELLQSLANIQNSCLTLLEAEKLGSAAGTEEILELQLLDYDGTGIEADRLAKFVSIIIRLHTDLARILGISEDRLRYVYFDSGSDLVAGIKCAAERIDKVKMLFKEFWERIVFRRYEDFGKKMDAIAKGLSIVGTIQDAVKQNTISQEEGSVLRTRVLGEVGDLIGIGATLPLHEGAVTVDQRKLLIESRDAKLLGSGQPAEAPDGPPEEAPQVS